MGTLRDRQAGLTFVLYSSWSLAKIADLASMEPI
jgi:hypothetical protein